MAATNRHAHFVEKLETLLDTVSGLNILTVLNMNKWKDYQYPYAYVVLGPDETPPLYEDAGGTGGKIAFSIATGVSVASNEDIRAAGDTLIHLIEKAFRNYKMDELTVAGDFDLDNIVTRLTNLNPIPSDESTKQFFIIEGEITYDEEWL